MKNKEKDLCNAALYLADDHGDNSCTFRCQLPKGHDGWHKEERKEEEYGSAFLLTWEKDERQWCDLCGKERKSCMKITEEDMEYLSAKARKYIGKSLCFECMNKFYKNS